MEIGGYGSREEPLEPAEVAMWALESPRFEIVPVKGALDEAGYLPEGAEVAITCSPALGIENTLTLAEELSERNLRVVPHLSARLVTSEAHLKEILARMDAGGLRDVFVVGGDVREPAGPFDSGKALLEAMERLAHGIERIGVPAYPEGHPLVGEERLTQALLEKQPFASYMVTQICFDPETIVGWLERVRSRGGELPVYVGVPGVVDRLKLLGISLKIGLGTSVRYLRKQHGWAGRLMAHGGYSPDHLIEDLSPHMGDPSLGIRGFHINTFNQVESTESWRHALLENTRAGQESREARS